MEEFGEVNRYLQVNRRLFLFFVGSVSAVTYIMIKSAIQSLALSQKELRPASKRPTNRSATKQTLYSSYIKQRKENLNHHPFPGNVKKLAKVYHTPCTSIREIELIGGNGKKDQLFKVLKGKSLQINIRHSSKQKNTINLYERNIKKRANKQVKTHQQRKYLIRLQLMKYLEADKLRLRDSQKKYLTRTSTASLRLSIQRARMI